MILTSVIYFYVFLLWGTCINDAIADESAERCCCDEKKKDENIFRLPHEGIPKRHKKNYTTSSEDIFRNIGNDSDIIHTSETLDKGYYTALCWSEIMTITERSNGSKSITKEYAITFETQADIPEKYLKTKQNTSDYKQYRIYNQHTKRSQVVNFTTISRTDDVVVRQHRRMLCGSGPIYTKELINWPQSDRKRIEIKVSPKKNNIVLTQQAPGEDWKSPDNNQDPNDLTTIIYITSSKPLQRRITTERPMSILDIDTKLNKTLVSLQTSNKKHVSEEDKSLVDSSDSDDGSSLVESNETDSDDPNIKVSLASLTDSNETYSDNSNPIDSNKTNYGLRSVKSSDSPSASTEIYYDDIGLNQTNEDDSDSKPSSLRKDSFESRGNDSSETPVTRVVTNYGKDSKADMHELIIQSTTDVNEIATITKSPDKENAEHYDEDEDTENDFKDFINEQSTEEPNSSTYNLDNHYNTSDNMPAVEGVKTSIPESKYSSSRGRKKNPDLSTASYKSLDYETEDDVTSSLKTTDVTPTATDEPLTTLFKHLPTVRPGSSDFDKAPANDNSVTLPITDERTPFEFGGSANRIGFDNGHPTNMNNLTDTTAVYPHADHVKNSTEIFVPQNVFNYSHGRCTLPKQKIAIKVRVMINYILEQNAEETIRSSSVPIMGQEKEIEIPIESIKDILSIPDETVNEEWDKFLGDVGNHFFNLKKPFLQNFTEYVNNNLNYSDMSEAFTEILSEEIVDRIKLVKKGIDDCKAHSEDVVERIAAPFLRYPNEYMDYRPRRFDAENSNNPHYNYLMSSFPNRNNYQYNQPPADSSNLNDYKYQILQSLGLPPQFLNELGFHLLNEYRRQTRNTYPNWLMVRNAPSMYNYKDG